MGFVLSRTEVEALLPERRGSVLTPPDIGAGENLESAGVIDWPEATLRRLDERLQDAGADLAVALSERIARRTEITEPVVSVEYLGLAPGARLPGRSETVGTWMIQGPRPRETGRIAIETELAIGLVRGLLGGTEDEPSRAPDRRLSGLERSLLTRAVELVAAVVVCRPDDRRSQQWERARMDLSVRAETVVEASDHYQAGRVLAGFQWQLLDCDGLVHVELSSGFIDRLLESVDGAEENGGPDASQAVTGSLTARLPVSGLTPEDLEGLALGDVILTDRGVDPGTGVIDWDVWVDGQLRFRGQPGDFDRSRAVVLEPLEKVP
jgi:hypothetical protein